MFLVSFEPKTGATPPDLIVDAVAYSQEFADQIARLLRIRGEYMISLDSDRGWITKRATRASRHFTYKAVAVCSAIRCDSLAQPEHSPCCSAHGRDLCCQHYNRRHFVAVNQCSPDSHAAANAAATTTTERG